MGALFQGGTVSASAQFIPEVAPSDAGQMPLHVDRQFNSVSELLNKISEGELLPPVVDLPKRFNNGTIKLIVPDNEGKLPEGIPSAGVYLYAGGDWYSFALTKV